VKPQNKIADAYEVQSGKPWIVSIGGCYSGIRSHSRCLEAGADLDKEAIRKAFAATNVNTLQGPTKFNEKNVAVTPTGALQWIKGKKFPYDCVLVSNGNYKSLPVEAKAVSIRDLRGMK
jgi:hypothetical protein